MKLPVQTIGLAALFLVLCSLTKLQARPVSSLLLGQYPILNRSGQLNEPLIFAAPPLPDGIGEPTRRSEAGSRGCEDESKQSAASEKKLLTALVPVYPDYQPSPDYPPAELVLGTTTAFYPTFWFYIPYQPPFTGEFVLQDKEGNLVYKTNVMLPETPGVISFSLPSTEPPLKIGERYHWYFKIYCRSEPPPSFVDGWLQIVSLNPDLKSQIEKATLPEQVALYAINGIWYEALTAAAELRRTDPNDTNWTALLQAVGLDNFAKEPMVECCKPVMR